MIADVLCKQNANINPIIFQGDYFVSTRYINIIPTANMIINVIIERQLNTPRIYRPVFVGMKKQQAFRSAEDFSLVGLF